MKRKSTILSLFLLALPLLAGAQEPGYPQVDTLVIRRDSLDAARGVIRSIPDTIFFVYRAEAVFPTRVSLEEEMTFKPLRIVDAPITPMEHLADPVERLAKARAYRLAYRFEDAMKACQQAAMWADDALMPQVEQESNLILNCMGMTDKCQTPVAVMKQRFTLKEFYLYFPFTDRSFRSTPNAFDSGESIIPTYVPKNSKTVYFSSPDSGGARNIYMSENRDSCWTAPVLLNESMVTLGNEIAPVLSQDGKTLYFASDALYGMGGYDLYKCQWDDQAQGWGEPVNLGFPFSSPADDFMLMETDDRKYTIFASNRECAADSVYIYVLKHEDNPAVKAVTSADELLALSLLKPSVEEAQIDNTAIGNIGNWNEEYNSGTLYMEVFARTEELQTTIKQLTEDIEKLEGRLETEEDAVVRESIARAIDTKKIEKAEAEKTLSDLTGEFGNIEDLLSNASSLSTSKVAEAADTELVGAGDAYVFHKHRMGGALKAKVLPWEQHPRTVFKISPVGHFGPDGSLPQDFYYQILFLESKRRCLTDDFNGLNPVYERQTRRLMYQYYTGVFRCYQDALHALNEVRRRGFPEAVITAYNGASPISVEEALELEAAVVEEESILQ
ncbi:MAG: PD40 domain-containing protein [Bacteroidales bacterium]|nr:PD40 domain-containing protein [Bacteroidales bacterium]